MESSRDAAGTHWAVLVCRWRLRGGCDGAHSAGATLYRWAHPAHRSHTFVSVSDGTKWLPVLVSLGPFRPLFGTWLCHLGGLKGLHPCQARDDSTQVNAVVASNT